MPSLRLRRPGLRAALVTALSLTFPARLPAQQPDAERIPVLVVSGQNNHDCEWTTPMLESMLELSGKFEVDVTTDPASTLADADGLRRYRAFVLDYNGARWGVEAEECFVEAVESGTGVVVLHAANNAFDGWVEYETMVGHCWREGTGHGRFHRFDVEILHRDHPVTRELPPLIGHPDELYHRLVHMHDAPHRVLATAHSATETRGSGQDEPMIVVLEYGQGRIFHTPLGHVWRDQEATRASYHDPQFQDLVIRGTEWAATGEVTPERVNQLTRGEIEAGWKLLFDGSSTEHWRGFRSESFPAEGWSIEDGALKVSGGGGDIITRDRYASFELSLEWKVAPGANSGIMYRVSEELGAPWQTGPEYQILDDDRHRDGQSPLTSAASLYALYPVERPLLLPVGRYNRARIKVHGSTVEHYLNGIQVVSATLGSGDWNERVAASKFASMPRFGKLEEGHLCLQDHGDEVWFRNLKVRELEGQ